MCEGMDVRNVVVQERWYWARLNIAVLVVRRREISASVRGTASATLSERWPGAATPSGRKREPYLGSYAFLAPYGLFLARSQACSLQGTALSLLTKPLATVPPGHDYEVQVVGRGMPAAASQPVNPA
jgi:hypothetical protein